MEAGVSLPLEADLPGDDIRLSVVSGVDLRSSVVSVPCTRELVCSSYFPRNGDSKHPVSGRHLESLDLMGYARTGVAVANIGLIACSDAVKAAVIDGYGKAVSNIGPNADSGLSISDLLGFAPLSSVTGRSDNGFHPEVSILCLDDGDIQDNWKRKSADGSHGRDDLPTTTICLRSAMNNGDLSVTGPGEGNFKHSVPTPALTRTMRLGLIWLSRSSGHVPHGNSMSSEAVSVYGSANSDAVSGGVAFVRRRFLLRRSRQLGFSLPYHVTDVGKATTAVSIYTVASDTRDPDGNLSGAKGSKGEVWLSHSPAVSGQQDPDLTDSIITQARRNGKSISGVPNLVFLDYSGDMDAPKADIIAYANKSDLVTAGSIITATSFSARSGSEFFLPLRLDMGSTAKSVVQVCLVSPFWSDFVSLWHFGTLFDQFRSDLANSEWFRKPFRWVGYYEVLIGLEVMSVSLQNTAQCVWGQFGKFRCDLKAYEWEAWLQVISFVVEFLHLAWIVCLRPGRWLCGTLGVPFVGLALVPWLWVVL